MNIGFIGLGKLGFPCAVAASLKGNHTIYGYDSNSKLIDDYKNNIVTPMETGLDAQYEACRERIIFCEDIDDVVDQSEIIFVAVQTPHAKEHDGSYRYDGVPRNFDTQIIKNCLRDIGRSIYRTKSDHTIVCIVSTLVPTTCIDELYPIMKKAAKEDIGDRWDLIYNPSFIGQSTVVEDFLNPEFALIGSSPFHPNYCRTKRQLTDFYHSIHDRPLRCMTWTEAECVKLAYNTYLGLKILWANSIMEMCHRLPYTNCNVVNDTLKKATNRLISTKYMDGGMADGGPCHGRDQMVLSYIAKKLNMKFNIFDVINFGRDTQTEWLADIIEEHQEGRRVVLLGAAFKEGTNQLTGSPAMLLTRILKERGTTPIVHDPVIFPDVKIPDGPTLYFISTKWDEYKQWDFQPGDMVIDPWGIIEEVPSGVELISIGRQSEIASTKKCQPKHRCIS